MTSVDRIRPLRFSLIENSTPTVTTATISDAGELTIDYLAPGTSTITIAATDLDGLSVLHTFEIEVTNSFSFWASAMGLEGNAGDLQANPDGDAFDNFLEYAFGGTPTVDDSGAIATSAIQSPGNDNVLIPSISFFYRQNAGDLSYAVQTTNDLTKGWTPLWTSADGLGSPAVIKATPSRGLTKVTVGAKGIPLPAYLRIQVSAE